MRSFIGESQIYKPFFKKLILKPYKRLSGVARQGIRTCSSALYKRYNSKIIFPYAP